MIRYHHRKMNPFEAKMPDVETGSRRPEGESRFDASYEAMLDILQNKGDTVLIDFFRAMSADRKQALSSALNQNGHEWKFLAQLGKENSPMVITKIVDWENNIAMAADARAIQKSNRFLVDTLGNL